jgi:hypothetical protein
VARSLRIPSNDDIRATGAIQEAVAQVHSQNEAWTSKAPVTAPTLVAHTGTPATAAPAKPASSDASSKQTQERLALVPPRAGKGDAGADRAGASGGTGKDDAATKAELARTKEALTSREQEAAELKSRVKQLEDLGSKDQRLISMKDSEIADLQAKLKDLQAKTAANAAAAAAKPPVATTAAPAAAAPSTAGKPEQKVTAKDIWGDMSAADKAAADKAAAAGKPAAGTPTATTTPPTATAAATTPTPGSTTPAGSDAGLDSIRINHASGINNDAVDDTTSNDAGADDRERGIDIAISHGSNCTSGFPGLGHGACLDARDLDGLFGIGIEAGNGGGGRAGEINVGRQGHAAGTRWRAFLQEPECAAWRRCCAAAGRTARADALHAQAEAVRGRRCGRWRRRSRARRSP